jgi:hypothetical protein
MIQMPLQSKYFNTIKSEKNNSNIRNFYFHLRGKSDFGTASRGVGIMPLSSVVIDGRKL